MTRRHLALALLILTTALGTGAEDPGDLARLSHAVLFADEPSAREAAAALRAHGGAGMRHLLEVFDQSPGADPRRLDRACGARDCAASRLFWYTDFERALAAAKAAGKPILSLRLLGRLDEELSCANSRFFRSTLYPNREISRFLRRNFILHWRSVRPVPIVRVDFGDGRTLEQPLTGNSIHYVLDPAGRLVDALPGLYASDVFLGILREVTREIAGLQNLSDRDFRTWSRRRSARLVRELRRAQQTALAQVPGVRPDRINVGGNQTGAKSTYEGPMLRALEQPTAARSGPFQRLAVLYRDAARLDAASRALVSSKQGIADPRRAELLISAFERDIAYDTVINQYLNRVEIHRWLAGRRSPVELEAFNTEVYTVLFETPPGDPWLGLAPRSVYAALPSGGRDLPRDPGT